ncbi:MAG TPA: endo-1,4-beta-xylanase [Lacunisphaera sp.]|jgi:endo-1,4-beta-xylanase|nr:endo-1,4-beta-xylanase [Lacunisphaera sp.]
MAAVPSANRPARARPGRPAAALLFLWLGVAPLSARAPDPAAVTLRGAAPASLLIGCGASSRDVRDPRIAAMIARQFNCLTADNEMMPAMLVDDAGHYDFTRGDIIARFAHDHGMPFFGQMLVWHHITRDWLFKDAAGQPLPRDQALQNLRAYIQTVAGHYRGQVKAWNVVNEAISDDDAQYLRDTPARRAIGDDFIAKAFAFAHEADPAAELYYNDYNIELPAKRAKALRLLRSLRDAGVRVDAVGIQGHWHLEWPETSVIVDAIREFHAAGFPVMITELDVDVLPRTVSGADLVAVEEGPNPYPHGLPAAMQQRLAARYREIFEALLTPPGVTMITFWGPDDAHSWLNDFPVKHRTNYPLLFDRQSEPKPALFAVAEVLAAARHRDDQR